MTDEYEENCMIRENTENLTGQDISELIEKEYEAKVWFWNSPQINKAKAFLSSRESVDFMDDDEQAFELVKIFLEDLYSKSGSESYQGNALDVRHFFSYSPKYKNADKQLLILLNQLCQKLFSTSEEVVSKNNAERLNLEIEAILYFRKTRFFTEEMFGLLRKMSNPKEGIIALKIFHENNMEITPSIARLLYSTTEPAHLARIIHSMHVLNLLNNAESWILLEKTFTRWKLAFVTENNNEAKCIASLSKIIFLLSSRKILTVEILHLLLNPESETLLKNTDFIKLQDILLKNELSFPLVIWNAIVATYLELSSTDFQKKMKNLTATVVLLRKNELFLLEILLEPENHDFLMHETYLSNVRSLIHFMRSLNIWNDQRRIQSVFPLFLNFLKANSSEESVKMLGIVLQRLLNQESDLEYYENAFNLVSGENAALKVARLEGLIRYLKRNHLWSPVVKNTVFSPNNALILDYSDFNQLLRKIPPENFNDVWNAIGNIMADTGSFDPDRVENYLNSNFGTLPSRKVCNSEHIENFRLIENYLASINCLMDEEGHNNLEDLMDPDYASLYTLVLGSQSLASQIILIPAPVFIEQAVWKKLLACCRSEDSQRAFKVLIHDLLNHCIVHQEETQGNNRVVVIHSALDDFARLRKILEMARDTEARFRKQNAIAQFVTYIKPDYRNIGQFVQFIQEKNIVAMMHWLKDNVGTLNQNSVFKNVLDNQFCINRPFGCENLSTLQTALEQYLSAPATVFEETKDNACFL